MEICLINYETLLGPVKALCFENYVIYGVILFIVGLLIASLIPVLFVKKIGLVMMLLGVIMAIFFPLIAGWWLHNLVFRLVIYGVIFLTIMYLILFKGIDIKKVRR